MPNHVLNILELIGKQSVIDNLLEKIKYDDKPIGTIDFNKIIPMPASLDITSGSEEKCCIMAYLKAVAPFCVTDYGIEKLSNDVYTKTLEKLNANPLYIAYSTEEIMQTDLESELGKDRINKGEIYIDNLWKYGATTWYYWCRNNWGTKWNSYDSLPLENNTLTFNTAWSNAHPVITKLSKMYPDIRFEYAWADEDFGANVGKCRIERGQTTHLKMPINCSKEAYQMAAKIRKESLEDHNLVYDSKKGTYVHR